MKFDCARTEQFSDFQPEDPRNGLHSGIRGPQNTRGRRLDMEDMAMVII